MRREYPATSAARIAVRRRTGGISGPAVVWLTKSTSEPAAGPSPTSRIEAVFGLPPGVDHMLARILAHKPDPGNGVGLHYSRFRRYSTFTVQPNQSLAPYAPRENPSYRPPIREVRLRRAAAEARRFAGS